jgi:hypothetical protein
MNQFLKPTVACLAVLGVGMFGMQGLCAQDGPDLRRRRNWRLTVMVARCTSSAMPRRFVSPGQVVGRLLSGYDYAAKDDGLMLEVTVLDKRGEVAAAASSVVPVRRRPSE